MKNMKTIIKKAIIIYLWVLFLPIALTLKSILFLSKILKKLFLFVSKKANSL